MKQRLSIIQGFLGNPEIIILDEPTRGLDMAEQDNMYHFISQYSHKIMLVSSHIIQDIENTCSSVIIIHKGKILYIGTIANLLKYHLSLRDAYLHLVKSAETFCQ
jgi:ABC-2 type transport system ATP-binding protein